MMGWTRNALGAAMALACTPALAEQPPGDRQPARAGPEVAVGLLAHGANFHPLGERLFFPKLPPGVVYDGGEEDGTLDVQFVYRTAPIRFALKPRFTAKLQLSTAGRTSFGSIGAEWRQHVLHRRLYGQLGIGLTVHDGYRFTPDPFVPGLPIAEARRRYAIYRTRVSFGSQVLLNPNAAIGVRIDPHWAIEATWEHFSHHQWFSERNPGIDNVGVRLVHAIGGRR